MFRSASYTILLSEMLLTLLYSILKLIFFASANIAKIKALLRYNEKISPVKNYSKNKFLSKAEIGCVFYVKLLQICRK
jgi:hypothetical protein